MAYDPLHGHAALRRGRYSEPSSTYFLTICTEHQKQGLTKADIASTIWSELTYMETDLTWHVRCGVIMPDHLHILIRLGDRLLLEQTIQRLKPKTGPALCAENLKWERGFFDRRLRPDDPILPIFLYIYLNPYRTSLCKPSEAWSEYHCCEEDWTWFSSLLDQDLPAPEWLA